MIIYTYPKVKPPTVFLYWASTEKTLPPSCSHPLYYSNAVLSQSPLLGYVHPSLLVAEGEIFFATQNKSCLSSACFVQSRLIVDPPCLTSSWAWLLGMCLKTLPFIRSHIWKPSFCDLGVRPTTMSLGRCGYTPPLPGPHTSAFKWTHCRAM